MRKRLYRIVLKDFLTGLENLGYHPVRPDRDPCLSWKRNNFHVNISHVRRVGRLFLSVHKDEPTCLPPFHKARRSGEDIKKEFFKITHGYGKVRARKTQTP